MFYAVVRFLGRPLVYLLFWPSLKNKEVVPKKGAAILAGNHLGTGEAILIPALIPRQVTFPAKQELFRTDTILHKMGAWFLRMFHQVPMDRAGGEASADALGSIYEVLEEGGVVAIHPEGHRSPDGRLYKGHTGVARLALRSGAPVIPFGCFRTRFTRKWLPFPWLYRPEIRLGEPFTFPDQLCQDYLQAPNREEAGAILREATDEVMRRIQAITGQEMVDEYSYRAKAIAATNRAPDSGPTPTS